MRRFLSRRPAAHPAPRLAAALCGAAVLAGLLLPGAAALAADAAFTPAQREAIIGIVRDALKTDPTILRDAVGALQADDDSRARSAAADRVRARHADIYARQADPMIGNPHADVTLVEFYDPRCGYCRRVRDDVIGMVKSDGKLRIVFKDIPVLGPASEMETRAILAAGKQNAYLAMQAAMMTETAAPSESLIRDKATRMGLDADKLIADMGSDAVTRHIKENLALAQALGVGGTPTFVVGDQLLPGAQEIDALTAAIAAARARKG